MASFPMQNIINDKSFRLSIVACMYVCLPYYVHVHISGTAYLLFPKIAVQVTYGCGSVLLWQFISMLCTSGFVDGIMFAHNGQELVTWRNKLKVIHQGQHGFEIIMN